LRKIPIVHVYGTLGEYPDTKVGDMSAWRKAYKSIRTIYEMERDHETLSQAKELLKNARNVCILGFGFHRENIEILELRKHLQALANVGVICSTCYDVRSMEWG